MSRSFARIDIDHNERQIVLQWGVLADPATHVADDIVNALIGRDGSTRRDQLLEARVAEELVAGIAGFNEPIREEDEAVARGAGPLRRMNTRPPTAWRGVQSASDDESLRTEL